jgi:hypothetical protein
MKQELMMSSRHVFGRDLVLRPRTKTLRGDISLRVFATGLWVGPDFEAPNILRLRSYKTLATLRSISGRPQFRGDIHVQVRSLELENSAILNDL